MQAGPNQEFPDKGVTAQDIAPTASSECSAQLPKISTPPLLTVSREAARIKIEMSFGIDPIDKISTRLGITVHTINEQGVEFAEYVLPLQTLETPCLDGLIALSRDVNCHRLWHELRALVRDYSADDWVVRNLNVPSPGIPFCTQEPPPIELVEDHLGQVWSRYGSSREIEGERYTLGMTLQPTLGILSGCIQADRLNESTLEQPIIFRVLANSYAPTPRVEIENTLRLIACDVVATFQFRDLHDVLPHLESLGYVVLKDPANEREFKSIDLQLDNPFLPEYEGEFFHEKVVKEDFGISHSLRIGSRFAEIVSELRYGGQFCSHCILLGDKMKGVPLTDLNISTVLAIFKGLVSEKPWEVDKSLNALAKMSFATEAPGTDRTPMRRRDGVGMVHSSSQIQPTRFIPPSVIKFLSDAQGVQVLPDLRSDTLTERLGWMCQGVFPVNFTLAANKRPVDFKIFNELTILFELKGGLAAQAKTCFGGELFISVGEDFAQIGSDRWDERFLRIVEHFSLQPKIGWEGFARELIASDLPGVRNHEYRVKNIPKLYDRKECDAYSHACELAFQLERAARGRKLSLNLSISIGENSDAWVKACSKIKSSFLPDIEYGVNSDGIFGIRVWGYWKKGEVPLQASPVVRDTLVMQCSVDTPFPLGVPEAKLLEQELVNYFGNCERTPMGWHSLERMSTYPKLQSVILQLFGGG